MGDFNSFGKLIILSGILLLALGIVITFGGKMLPFGRLPGDIFIRKGNFSFYFPIVTSIVLSIILTIILNFFAKR
ncbi:MAG TPA: DUF2905 domain-containing protein [Desulfobacteria bacterium]|nr:DUF2905 domain-containing protein [Desulfobacteria bacterium]